MKLIHHIALKEFKESLRSRSLRITGVLLFIFLITSVSFGIIHYMRLKTEKKVAKLKVREQWLNQGTKNPHGAGHYGMLTFKPTEPLNALELGTSNYFGQYIYLETHTRNDAEKKPVKDASSLVRNAEFTTAFLFQFIIPLLIIFLSYSAISYEKENNTLRLVLSQQVSSYTFIIGKCLGNIYKLTVVLVPALIVSYALLVFATDKHNDVLLMHTIICVFYLIYFLSFLLIAIGVSAFSKSSKQSLLILFLFWIFSCVFIPRFSSSLSEHLYPTPSSFDLKTNYEKQQGNKYVYGYKGFKSFSTTYSKIEERLMREYRVTHADSLPVNVFGLAIEETEEEAQQLFEKMYGELNKQFQQQHQLHRYTAFLSPLAAIRFLSMGLSHSDQEEQFNFSDHSEQYRRMLMKTLNMDIAYHSKKNKGKYERGKELWQEIPDFNYTGLSLEKIFRNHWCDALILMLWLLASVLFVKISSKKIRIA